MHMLSQVAASLVPGRRHGSVPYQPYLSFLRWSSLATWGGAFPTPGAALTIPVGTNIIFDVSMADTDAPGIIHNNGNIVFDPTINTRLICDGIDNCGTMTAGSSTVPHPTNIEIALCGPRPTVSGNSGGGPLITGYTHDPTTDAATGNNGTTNDNYGYSRGFMNCGKLNLYGNFTPIPARLNAAVLAGATTITIDRLITAPAGATVLVTPDGFFNASTRTESRTLAAPVTNSNVLTLNAALTFPRWGQLQYQTDAGVSLTSGTFTTMRTDATQDPTIDQRAFVCIFAPSIKIKGYDYRNTDLATYGFGFHGMTEPFLTSETVIKNVGMENYGQLGLLGRYGWHFHIPSWNADGTAKTDGYNGTNVFPPDKALIDGVTGINGFNRFMDIHACLGATVQNCIGYQAAGHAFFYEDGAEEQNTMQNNVAIAPYDPGTGNRLKTHDNVPVGFWFANPNNNNINNWGVDTPGGPWTNQHSFGLLATQIDRQHGCLGFSANVPICPAYGKLGTWDGNSGLCNGAPASSLNGPTSNNGNTANRDKITTTSDGLAYPGSQGGATDVPFLLKNARLYKGFGYLNSVNNPNYLNWRVVDHQGPAFQGITNSGTVNNPILIRESLNHESHYLANIISHGFAAYHGTLAFVKVSADGYSGGTPTVTYVNTAGPAIESTAVQQTWEEYTLPIQDFMMFNTGWAMRNSSGVWQTPPAHITEATTTYDSITGTTSGGGKFMVTPGNNTRHYTLGILYDAWGYLSTGPSQAGVPHGHIIWNQPYLTTGVATPVALQNNPQSVVTTTPYMGMDLAYGTGFTLQNVATTFQRVDTTGASIAGAIWQLHAFDTPPEVNKFHHGACPIGGLVRWSWPGTAKPTTLLQGNYYCAATGGGSPPPNPYLNYATDVTYWGIDWGAATAQFDCAGQVYDSTGITSLASLQASSGFKFWHDTTNGIVWIRLRVHRQAYQWNLQP